MSWPRLDGHGRLEAGLTIRVEKKKKKSPWDELEEEESKKQEEEAKPEEDQAASGGDPPPEDTPAEAGTGEADAADDPWVTKTLSNASVQYLTIHSGCLRSSKIQEKRQKR